MPRFTIKLVYERPNRMPRFTIKDLLIATTLIANGVFQLTLSRDGENASPFAIAFLWFSGGVLIGVGLFIPFNRPWTGLFKGLVIQALFLFLFIFTIH